MTTDSKVVVEATRHQRYGGVWYSNGQRFTCTAADAADLYALRLAKAVPQPVAFLAMPPPLATNRELIAERPVAAAAPLQPHPEVAPTRRYRRRDLKTKFHGKG